MLMALRDLGICASGTLQCAHRRRRWVCCMHARHACVTVTPIARSLGGLAAFVGGLPLLAAVRAVVAQAGGRKGGLLEARPCGVT